MKDKISLDLRQEICPMTFVKAKLAIEELDTGDVMEVLLGSPSALENVPRSLKDEGHQILEIKKLSDKDWSVLVRKN